jgi:hypothetical protein
MATYEVWKTVTYEAFCHIEAESLEEAKQLLQDEAQDWDSIDGQEETYTINGEKWNLEEEGEE